MKPARRIAPLAAAALATALAAVITALPAQATSGPGCLRLHNIAANDALNMRAAPSATSRIVDVLIPGGHGVIALSGRCGPLNRPWGQRWCEVTHYSGDRTTSGYVKARFVRDSECP
jgi:hypothetical protein